MSLRRMHHTLTTQPPTQPAWQCLISLREQSTPLQWLGLMLKAEWEKQVTRPVVSCLTVSVNQIQTYWYIHECFYVSMHVVSKFTSGKNHILNWWQEASLFNCYCVKFNGKNKIRRVHVWSISFTCSCLSYSRFIIHLMIHSSLSGKIFKLKSDGHFSLNSFNKTILETAVHLIWTMILLFTTCVS